MSFSEVTRAGAGMLDLYLMKKKYPDDWPALEKLGSALGRKKLIAERPPGELAIVIKQRAKSLIKFVDWKGLAYVSPGGKSAFVAYFPFVMLPEQLSTPLFEFVARVNSMLPAGCFIAHGPLENPRTGKSGMALKYRIGFIYGDCANQSIHGLLANLVRNAVDVSDIFEQSFQALANGSSAVASLQTMRPVIPPRLTPGGDKVLLDALMQGLSLQELECQPATGEQAYLVTRNGERNEGWTRTARVTDDRRIMVESVLDTTVSESQLGSVLAFLDIANDKLAGTGESVFRYETNKVGYRTVLDARDAEKELTPRLIAHSLDLHLIREDIVLNGAKDVISGLTLNEAMQKILTYLPGTDEILSSKASHRISPESGTAGITSQATPVVPSAAVAQQAPASATIYCHKCGAANASGHKFCMKCGSALMK